MNHKISLPPKLTIVQGAFNANMALLMSTPLLLIFFGNFKELYYYLNRYPTLQTQATILEARIGYVSYSARWGRTKTYFLKYRYSVGGKTYVSTGLHFNGDPTKRFNLEEILNYKVGQRYPIYYLGKFPHYSALYNYWSGWQWSCVYLTLALMISIPLQFRLYGIRKRLEQQDKERVLQQTLLKQKHANTREA